MPTLLNQYPDGFGPFLSDDPRATCTADQPPKRPLLATDSPTYLRRLVREVKRLMRAGAGVRVGQARTPVVLIRLSRGKVMVATSGSLGATFDATTLPFWSETGEQLAASREVRP